MADLFLKSFENSQLNLNFKEKGYTNISYSGRSGMPPRVVKIMQTPQTTPTTGTLANQTASFRIPRVGHLLGAVVKWTATATAAITVTNPIGMTIAKSMVFNSGAYPLYRQSDCEALVARQSSPVAKACNLHNLALPLRAKDFVPTAGTDFVTFCNLNASFFEDEENLYDCQNNVQATIDCLINGASGMGIPDGSVLTALSGTLITFHVLYDSETENLLLATNRPKGTVQMQLGIDSSYRSATVAAGLTASITINSNACLRQLAFRIHDTLTASRTPHSTEPFNNYSFSVNGEYLHYQVPRVMGVFLGNQKGFSGNLVSNGVAAGAIIYEGQGWTILPFGSDVLNKTQESGMLALKNLNQVVIDVVALTGDEFVATDIIEYVTEEWVMYEFDVYSGEVSIAIAS